MGGSTMVVESKRRVLSVRAADDIIDYIDIFRRGQIARPSQTEALRVLVRLGLEKWQEQDRTVRVCEPDGRADSQPLADRHGHVPTSASTHA